MFHELDLDVLANEAVYVSGPWSPPEIEDIVVFTRITRYNRALPCGPKALHLHLRKLLGVDSVPSERTIAGILARNGLTHQRTGRYPGEPESIEEAVQRRNNAEKE